MKDPGEPWEVCPYNKAHVVLKSRIQFHLHRCRVQHPNVDKTLCPFNSTHVVNKAELELHMEVCPNRIVVDSFVMRVGTGSRPKGILPVQNIDFNFRPDECWDNEPTGVNVVELVKEQALKKKILIAKVGGTKSERKQHQINERKRHEALRHYLPPPEYKEQPKVAPDPPKPSSSNSVPSTGNTSVAPQVVNTPNTSVAPQVVNTPDSSTKGSRPDNDKGLQDKLKTLSLNPNKNDKPKPAPKKEDKKCSWRGIGSGNRCFDSPPSNRPQPATSSESSDPSVKLPPSIHDSLAALPPGGIGRGRRRTTK